MLRSCTQAVQQNIDTWCCMGVLMPMAFSRLAIIGAMDCPKGVASTSAGRLVMCGGMPSPVRKVASSSLKLLHCSFKTVKLVIKLSNSR